MSTHRVLIDMANLRSGGALQVAGSFMDELGALVEQDDVVNRHPWLRHGLDVEVSPQVRSNLSRPMSPSLRVTVTGRARPGPLPRRRHEPAYDVSFVLFGPDYRPRRAQHRIVGFADGLSLTDLPLRTVLAPGLRARLRHLTRRRIARASFRRADALVVEAAHVRAALHRRWSIDPSRIHVVPNTLNAVFEPTRVGHPGEAAEGRRPLVFFPTRPYPHKNLEILGDVARHLGDEVRFALTLDDAEWAACSPRLHSCSVNLGPLTVEQLPDAYRTADAVIFPSLEESFSATPLEAMAMRRPLVASDRAFVREICADAAWYAEPTDARALAAQLRAALTPGADRTARLDRGRAIVSSWPTARDRAESYLALIESGLAATR